MSRSVVPWSASSPAGSGGRVSGASGGGGASLPLTALFPVPFVGLLLLLGWVYGELPEVAAFLAIVILGTFAAVVRITHRSGALLGPIPAPVEADPPRVQPSRPSASRHPVTVTTWVTDTPRGRLERAPLALPAGPVVPVTVGEVRLSEPA